MNEEKFSKKTWQKIMLMKNRFNINYFNRKFIKKN